MAQITFTINDAKIQKVIDTMKWLFPIPRIEDPSNLGQQPPVMINEFTDAQWAKEAIRRYIISQVKRKEDYEAKNAVNIPSDDTLVT